MITELLDRAVVHLRIGQIAYASLNLETFIRLRDRNPNDGLEHAIKAYRAADFLRVADIIEYHVKPFYMEAKAA